MENPYKILGVSQNASIAEIKRAYRAKAKILHPDASGSESSEEFRKIVQAYELLIDSRSRSLFDESNAMHFRAKKNREWDYREWLLARNDDESRAKLIFFDLMHAREDDAVREFKRMSSEKSSFRLSNHFTRENFMDYGFILAEELIIRREYYDALLLLEQIIRMEHSFSYFRHFFPEVMDLARSVLRNRIDGAIPDELALDCFERALDLGFSKSDDAFFLRKMAQIYRRIGDERTARICEEESTRL